MAHCTTPEQMKCMMCVMCVIGAGHIYAGGALFGLCHDYIVMNSRKGFFCFPEVCVCVCVCAQ